MKKYKEFKIILEPFEPEIVTGLLWDLEITGINEEKDFLVVFADEKSSTGTKGIESILSKLQKEKILRSFSVSESLLEDKNWNEEWEKSIQVVEVDGKIVIKPSFRKYEEKPGQIIITIDPKMSFGTGEHQTTQIMIKLLEKHLIPSCELLDVGSGTGILAIAAVKLGAKNAVAVDIDEWCLMNGLENCRLNNVEDKIDIKQGELKDIEDKKFDMVLANINKNILIEIKNEIRKRLSSKGILILSGLLFSDENDICSHYEPIGFKVIEKMQMKEWIGLVLKWY
ncbi:MAG: 50S ribosomal protein L11 methyltransferase [Ignavibacteria bacterium]|nr:50S ribosomal protein L11 methyltransferase [Ignavibacteria bacterium]